MKFCFKFLIINIIVLFNATINSIDLIQVFYQLKKKYYNMDPYCYDTLSSYFDSNRNIGKNYKSIITDIENKEDSSPAGAYTKTKMKQLTRTIFAIYDIINLIEKYNRLFNDNPSAKYLFKKKVLDYLKRFNDKNKYEFFSIDSTLNEEIKKRLGNDSISFFKTFKEMISEIKDIFKKHSLLNSILNSDDSQKTKYNARKQLKELIVDLINRQEIL
jgi:hypothetical protein